MAPSGSGPPIVGVKWGGEPKLVGPEGPGPSRPTFGAIFGHFEPFGALFGPLLTLFGPLGEGQRLQVGPDPLWGKMERGVKIGGSRGPKCRQIDPLLGPFWLF